MKDGAGRKRVIWIAAIGGTVLLSLLFISLLAPAPSSGTPSPVIRPGAEATADGPSGATAGETKDRESFSLGGGQALSLAWRLGLVVVIVGVSIGGLRWWGKKTMGPRSSTGFLRVVDTLAISNGRSIHLVALGDRVIAVGATAQQLSLLGELTGDEAARMLAAIPSRNDQSFGGFAAELVHSLHRESRTGRPLARESVIGEEV